MAILENQRFEARRKREINFLHATAISENKKFDRKIRSLDWQEILTQAAKDFASRSNSIYRTKYCYCGHPKCDSDGVTYWQEIGKKNQVRCRNCGRIYQRPGTQESWYEGVARRAANLKRIPQNAIHQTIAAWVWLVTLLMALQIFGISAVASCSSARPSSEIRRNEE